MSQAPVAAESALERTPPTRVRWRIVALLIAFSFMTWFNRVSMSVAYDERIKEQTGISPEAMGYVYSAFLFAYMIFMTPGGWFIDRFGAWTALVVMGFGSAFFGVLTGLAGHPAIVSAGLLLPALLVVRSLMGIFTAPVYPSTSRLVSHWLPASQRAGANGLVQGAAVVGIASTFFLFGGLMDWFGWPTAFVISGAVTAVLALTWMIYGANDPSEHRGVNVGELESIGAEGRPSAHKACADEVSSWTLLRNRSLMLLTISYTAVGYFEYLFFFWIHYYFEKVLDLGKAESRAYSTILFVAMAAGMMAGGWAADRLRGRYGSHGGRAVVAIIGMCGGGILLLVGTFAEDLGWIVTLLALSLALVAAVEGPVWTTAIELGGRHGGTAAAICNTGGNLGFVAPIITPLMAVGVSEAFSLSERAGWQWAIALGSFITIAGGVLWFWIKAPERADAATSA
jgi:MFS family permease